MTVQCFSSTRFNPTCCMAACACWLSFIFMVAHRGMTILFYVEFFFQTPFRRLFTDFLETAIGSSARRNQGTKTPFWAIFSDTASGFCNIIPIIQEIFRILKQQPIALTQSVASPGFGAKGHKAKRVTFTGQATTWSRISEFMRL